MKVATKMAVEPTIGHTMRGRLGNYILNTQLARRVWKATNECGENVVIKSTRHWGLENERDLLARFQRRTPFLRPMLDEISEPPAIILRYLDDDLLKVTKRKGLARMELKAVAKAVLEALKVLHRAGFIYTDVKPDNILVNYGYGTGGTRFSDIQLADLGSAIHQDDEIAKGGSLCGTTLWRSPEAHLETPWGTSTDIWSFGATLISLLFGETYHIFHPGLPGDDPEFDLQVLIRHYMFFGPLPIRFDDVLDKERVAALVYIMELCPPEKIHPFHNAPEHEVSKEDREFISRIMKIDLIERPTAEELLEDSWFADLRQQEKEWALMPFGVTPLQEASTELSVTT